MKQVLFCYKNGKDLTIRYDVVLDNFNFVVDVISPQKTTFKISKTNNVELGDIVIVRDNTTNIVEYIGYVDTLTNKTTTEISCLPIISIFDNDYILDQMYKTEKQEKRNENGDVVVENGEVQYEDVDVAVEVVGWLETQLKRAFIDTDDNLQSLPLEITDKTEKLVLYEKILDTSNLFEVYVDLFVNTGVYIVFGDVKFNQNKISAICCDIYCNTDKSPYILRCDNPLVQNFDIVDNTFTNANKIIATQELSEEQIEQGVVPQRYFFYLLNDNSITRDANDSRRIKQVRSKEITFSLEENKTEEENANALILSIYNELQAPEYNLQITIDMLNDDRIKLYNRVDFISDKTYNDNGVIKNVIYSSNITKIENINNKQIRVTLGALRNNLTDFKKKVEEI
jgi:hypothetical protein